MTNKRSFERSFFNQPIVLEMSIYEGQQIKQIQYEGTAQDISRGGLGLITANEFSPGEILKVNLPVRYTDMVVPIFAKTVWSTWVQGQYRVGLQFLI